jgi:hypothetical protein
MVADMLEKQREAARVIGAIFTRARCYQVNLIFYAYRRYGYVATSLALPAQAWPDTNGSAWLSLCRARHQPTVSFIEN